MTGGTLRRALLSSYDGAMLWKEINAKRAEIVALGRHYHARRLAVFGSATTEAFDPAYSDVDFLVEFEEMPPIEYANAYFGLLEGLEELLGRQVDLVTESSLENPYLAKAVEASRMQLYAT